ncbi:MAG: hypothetical protein A2Z38_02745 [Planctomycetes bacterium RBG_19FT_COMBO_48_8]|nr:MAG: hypothetical protein A2Z38_02745 [Planctomycetes bacterium RBG_19FT_COMBO_48_8]
MINNSSGKKKTVLIASAAVVAVVVIGVLLRGIFSSPASSRQEIGLSSLSVTDENGDKWVLELAKGQSLAGLRDSSAKPGPPLLIKTDVQISGSDVSIGLIVEGQAGEKYAGGVQKNGQWQQAPAFNIVDEAGKVLASGRFKYG